MLNHYHQILIWRNHLTWRICIQCEYTTCYQRNWFFPDRRRPCVNRALVNHPPPPPTSPHLWIRHCPEHKTTNDTKIVPNDFLNESLHWVWVIYSKISRDILLIPVCSAVHTILNVGFCDINSLTNVVCQMLCTNRKDRQPDIMEIINLFRFTLAVGKL